MYLEWVFWFYVAYLDDTVLRNPQAGGDIIIINTDIEKCKIQSPLVFMKLLSP